MFEITINRKELVSLLEGRIMMAVNNRSANYHYDRTSTEYWRGYADALKELRATVESV